MEKLNKGYYATREEKSLLNHSGIVYIYHYLDLWLLSVGKSMTLDKARTKKELVKKYNL